VGAQYLERHADLSAASATPRRVLAAIGLTGALALGLAWVLQHRYDYQPCPWCVLQRLLVWATTAVCLAGSLVRRRRGHLCAAFVAGVLSCAGVGVALYQHVVAAKTASCQLTLADRIMGRLGLAEIWPGMFEATARCDEADRAWLGVPFSLWGAALFTLFAVAAIGLLLRMLQQRG
jgi:disulfide bond formation protein DsbB